MRTSIKTTVNMVNSVFVGLFIFGGYVQAQQFDKGTGEAGDPYRIAAAEQLMAIGSDPNLLDKHFMLVADIDLDPNLPNGRVFDGALIAHDILDANGLDAPGVPFTGSFDGGNHVIRNLVISAPTRYAVGLFGRIGIQDVGKWETPGVVQNVRLEGVASQRHLMVSSSFQNLSESLRRRLISKVSSPFFSLMEISPPLARRPNNNSSASGFLMFS